MSKIVIRYRSCYELRSMVDRYLFSRNITYVERNNNSPKAKNIGRYGYSVQYQGLQLFSTSKEKWTTFGSTMLSKDKREKIQPPVWPDSPWIRFPNWARWLLGTILTIAPFSNEKLKKLHTIEGRAEMVVDEVETAVEIIEKTAKVAEKVSSDVADFLPENGKLKQTALLVERVSKLASQEAQLAIDFIHKVDVLKHDLEDLETMVEPIENMKIKSKAEVN